MLQKQHEQQKVRAVEGVIDRIGLVEVSPTSYVVRLRESAETFLLCFRAEDSAAIALTSPGDHVKFSVNQYRYCVSFENLSYQMPSLRQL